MSVGMDMFVTLFPSQIRKKKKKKKKRKDSRGKVIFKWNGYRVLRLILLSSQG